MGDTSSVRTPRKRAMREGDFKPTTVEEQRPKLRYLLALCDRICCNEAYRRLALPHIGAGLQEPGRHIVERSSGTAEAGEPANLGAL
jgi:hypothetical protein